MPLYSLDRAYSRIDFGARRSVIAAVSGGSDSTALLVSLQDRLTKHHPGTTVRAVTIDHGLRAGSAAEAEAVAAICRMRGISHRIMAWTGTKPATGLQAAAREARYALLAKAAREAGTDLVITGHTLDDQAETVAMRARRGDGPGAAGMADATLYDGKLWILRPLLRIHRDALRTYLAEIGIDWIDDPSNLDRHFERVRVRAEIAASACDIAAGAAEAGHAREALGRRAAALIDAMTTLAAPGLLRLDLSHLAIAERAAATGALGLLSATIGGSVYLPPPRKLAPFLDPTDAGPLRMAVAGAVLDRRKDALWMLREFRGAGPRPQPAVAGTIWDHRFRIAGSDLRPGLVVAPVGKRAANRLAVERDDVPKNLVRAALAAEPALFAGDEFLGLARDEAAAHRAGAALAPVVAPHARFLPAFDLAPARALARLIGAAEIPEPPFLGHKRGETA